jgi:hypothetical protein
MTRFVLVWAIIAALIYGAISVFQVQQRGLEQLQTLQCIERPWLDTSHGC